MALFRRSLHEFEESKFGSLLILLSNVFLCRGEADRHIWKPRPSRLFSSKSFLRELEAVLGAKSSVSLAWWGWLPLEWKSLVGLQLLPSGKVSTTDNLRKRGLL